MESLSEMGCGVNILVVDDHRPTREQMAALISAEADLTVVAKPGSGAEAVAQCEVTEPDIVVMDIAMPGLNGIDATRQILAGHPHVKVIALSNHSGAILLQAVFAAGGAGYVRKDRAFEELIPAIRTVASGKTYVGAHADEA